MLTFILWLYFQRPLMGSTTEKKELWKKRILTKKWKFFMPNKIFIFCGQQFVTSRKGLHDVQALLKRKQVYIFIAYFKGTGER